MFRRFSILLLTLLTIMWSAAPAYGKITTLRSRKKAVATITHRWDSVPRNQLKFDGSQIYYVYNIKQNKFLTPHQSNNGGTTEGYALETVPSATVTTPVEYVLDNGVDYNSFRLHTYETNLDGIPYYFAIYDQDWGIQITTNYTKSDKNAMELCFEMNDGLLAIVSKSNKNHPTPWAWNPHFAHNHRNVRSEESQLFSFDKDKETDSSLKGNPQYEWLFTTPELYADTIRNITIIGKEILPDDTQIDFSDFVVSGNSNILRYNDATIHLDSYSDCVEFVGWIDNKDISGKLVSFPKGSDPMTLIIPKVNDKDLSYTLLFRRKTFSVTAKTGGGGNVSISYSK